MSRLTSFAWWVPIHGFQWETRDDNADESGPWLRPRPVRVSDLLPGTFDLPTRRYGPLDQHSALFHDFADLPLTTATIQRFADCYGPLTKDGIMPLGGVAYPGDKEPGKNYLNNWHNNCSLSLYERRMPPWKLCSASLNSCVL